MVLLVLRELTNEVGVAEVLRVEVGVLLLGDGIDGSHQLRPHHGTGKLNGHSGERLGLGHLAEPPVF